MLNFSHSEIVLFLLLVKAVVGVFMSHQLTMSSHSNHFIITSVGVVYNPLCRSEVTLILMPLLLLL